jgi:hypothetical protein
MIHITYLEEVKIAVCKVEFVQLDEENNDGFNRKYLLF